MSLSIATTILTQPKQCTHKLWKSPSKQKGWLLWQEGTDKIFRLTYGVCEGCQETVVIQDKMNVNAEKRGSSTKGKSTTLRLV